MEKHLVSDRKVLQVRDVRLLNNISGFFILLGLAAISQFLTSAAELSMNSYGSLTVPAAVVNAAVPAFLFTIGVSGLSRKMTHKDMKRCRLICLVLAVLCVVTIVVSALQLQGAAGVERVILIGLYLLVCCIFMGVTFFIESRMKKGKD